MNSDGNYANDYIALKRDVINKGYAERVNCIPHYGVYNTKTPGKIHVVFDCSGKFKGESLNDHLLSGPNLTNTLIGVLCHLCQEPIAFISDIEAMFHQFRVNPKHKNFLLFLWWENGDCNTAPYEYRMNRHLQQIATDYGNGCGADLTQFVHHNFFTWTIKSVSTEDEANNLISCTQDLCKKGAVRSHKFISNSKTVMKSIPAQDLVKKYERFRFMQ